MSFSRRNCRIAAFQILFALLFQKNNNYEDVLHIALEGKKTNADHHAFIKDRIEWVQTHRKSLDTLIQKHLVDQNFTTLPSSDYVILLLALFEMLFRKEEIPPVSVMNEYIEIAKILGAGDNSPKFINGILHTIFTEFSLGNSGKCCTSPSLRGVKQSKTKKQSRN